MSKPTGQAEGGSEYRKFATLLSSEFHRYLMENAGEAGSVPKNALVIFDVDGESDFNQWHQHMSSRNREPGQPVLHVHVSRLRSHSLMEDVTLATA